LSGCPNFFTHKLNWSLKYVQFRWIKLTSSNEFPLTTFNWVGLDGTQLLSHITPIQRYDSDCTLPEIMKGYSHHKNLDVTNESLLMFGNGDGGGGPSAVMLERLRRTRAAGLHNDRSGEQLPLVKTGFSLSEFFENTRKKTGNGKSLPAWYVPGLINADN
jgi:alpha-mannosidase